MIIALHGLPGSGKTYIAKQFEEYNFVRLSFAEPLKRLGMILGFTQKEMYVDKTHKNKFWHISGREFLRTFGTDIGQRCVSKYLPTMKHLWVRLLEKKLIELTSCHKNIIIDDLRFIPEFKMLRKYESCNVYVRTFGAKRIIHHLSDFDRPNKCHIHIINKKDGCSYVSKILTKMSYHAYK